MYADGQGGSCSGGAGKYSVDSHMGQLSGIVVGEVYGFRADRPAGNRITSLLTPTWLVVMETRWKRLPEFITVLTFLVLELRLEQHVLGGSRLGCPADLLAVLLQAMIDLLYIYSHSSTK